MLIKAQFSSIKSSFTNGKFARNVANMLAGNIAAQAIAFLAAPVIARLYTPAQFGDMTLVWSYTAMFAVISCLRYENSVVLEKNDKNAQNLLVLCLAIPFSIALVAGVVLIFCSENIAHLINLQGNNRLLWFIPFGLFSFGAFNALSFFYTRNKRFSALASCKVIGSLASVSFKIGIALILYASSFWLLFGNTIALLLPAAILMAGISYGKYPLPLSNISFRTMVDMASFYKEFPIYHGLTGIINNLSQNIPVFLFAFFFDSSIVGFYGLANSILRRPVGLVSESLSKVFLKDVIDKQHSRVEMKSSLVKTAKGLFFIGLIPFGCLMFFGEDLFIWFFGEQWTMAGTYAQVLSPWLFMGFINPPFTQIIIVWKKLQFNFYYNLINVLSKILLITLASFFLNDSIYILTIFSAVGVIMNLFYMHHAFSLVK